MTDQTRVGLDIGGTELHVGDRVQFVDSSGIFLSENQEYFHNPQDVFIIIPPHAYFSNMCNVRHCCDDKVSCGWCTTRFRKVLPLIQIVTRRLTVKVSNPNELAY